MPSVFDREQPVGPHPQVRPRCPASSPPDPPRGPTASPSRRPLVFVLLASTYGGGSLTLFSFAGSTARRGGPNVPRAVPTQLMFKGKAEEALNLSVSLFGGVIPAIE